MVRHEQLVHRTHVRDLLGERHQPLQRDRDTVNEPRHRDLLLEPRQEHPVLDPGPQPAVLLRLQSRVQRLHSYFFVISRPEPAGDDDWNPLKVAWRSTKASNLCSKTQKTIRGQRPVHIMQDEERKTRRNTTLVAATHLAGCTASSSQEAPLHFITRSLAEEKVVFAAQTWLTTWPAALAIPHRRNRRLSRQPLARSTKKTTLYRLFYSPLSQTHLTPIPCQRRRAKLADTFRCRHA